MTAAAAGIIAVPSHVRVGLQRAGPTLKVTVAREQDAIHSDEQPWPEEVEGRMVQRLDAEVLREGDAKDRAAAMRAIGGQLFDAFLVWSNLDVADRLEATRGGHLVVGCDQMTVRLPWELLHGGTDFLSRAHVLARQLEIGGPAA